MADDGLFREIRPAALFVEAAGAAPYASADDLVTVDDLPEEDLVIPRWARGGQALKIRIRALDLDQQDQIGVEALVKHKKTGAWETSNAAYCAATLREAVTVPRLTNEQAQAMRRHNPRIVEAIVRYIWLRSSFSDDRIEALAYDRADVDAHSPAIVPDDGADDPALA